MAEEAPPEEGSDAIVAAGEGSARPLLAKELREGRAAPILTGAALAWALSVAPAGFARGASIPAHLFAMLALGAGLAGPSLLERRPRLARHVGISLFAALATGTWLASSAAIHPMRLEPLRGALGAVAWGVFALAWSERWGSRPTEVAPDPDAPPLLARSTLPPAAVPVATLGVAAALAYLVFAFRVREPDRALVAQAVSLGCAVVVVSAAATVAVARGKTRSAGPRRLGAPVIRALLFLVTFAVAGAIVTILR